MSALKLATTLLAMAMLSGCEARSERRRIETEATAAFEAAQKSAKTRKARILKAERERTEGLPDFCDRAAHPESGSDAVLLIEAERQVGHRPGAVDYKGPAVAWVDKTTLKVTWYRSPRNLKRAERSDSSRAWRTGSGAVEAPEAGMETFSVKLADIGVVEPVVTGPNTREQGIRVRGDLGTLSLKACEGMEKELAVMLERIQQ